MAMAYLRAENRLIDLRKPLIIETDAAYGKVQVFHEKPAIGELGHAVARLGEKERASGDSDLQLRAISDSLANAIAYSTAYVAKNPQNDTAWILAFEPTGDNYWALYRADASPGVTPVYHIE